MTDPRTCHTMRELRAMIDDIDRELVVLLARRMACIDRATELKPGENMPARIETRVDEVIANARAAATAQRLDPDLVETLWRVLVEWSIAREERVLGDEGAPSGPAARS